MITWREFSEADFAYTRSFSESSSQSGILIIGNDTLTTRFSSSSLESSVFSGAYQYVTTSFGSTTSDGFAQTATATGSQSTFSTTFNVETSTVETAEVPFFRTQTTSEEYSFLTTTTTAETSDNEETFETWTTTTQAETREGITHESYTEQINATITTTQEETTAGNYWNTVYQAESDSVLLTAPQIELAQWDGIGQTLPTVTRTTVSAETNSLSVIALAASVVAGTASSPPQTLTNASSSSSIAWTRNTSYLTEITSANLLALPHSTFVTEILQNDSTTTTGATDSRASTTLTHRGNTYTRGVSYQVRKTLRRFNNTSSFAITFADRSVTTNTLTHGATFTTQILGGDSSGQTIGAAGISSTITQIPYCGIKAKGDDIGWLVYGISGAAGNGSAGLFYPITENLSFVEQAQTRWPVGRVSIFPATNESYTADASGLTWTTTTAGSQSATTQSSMISAEGSARTAFLLAVFRRLFGGVPAESETAVQNVGRGVYVNGEGETSFFEGDATSYSGSDFSQTSFWQPLPWLGEVPLFVSEIARNSTALPDFVNQREDIYPQEEF
jgi:hypothetical protein